MLSDGKLAAWFFAFGLAIAIGYCIGAFDQQCFAETCRPGVPAIPVSNIGPARPSQIHVFLLEDGTACLRITNDANLFGMLCAPENSMVVPE